MAKAKPKEWFVWQQHASAPRQSGRWCDTKEEAVLHDFGKETLPDATIWVRYISFQPKMLDPNSGWRADPAEQVTPQLRAWALESLAEQEAEKQRRREGRGQQQLAVGGR